MWGFSYGGEKKEEEEVPYFYILSLLLLLYNIISPTNNYYYSIIPSSSHHHANIISPTTRWYSTSIIITHHHLKTNFWANPLISNLECLMTWKLFWCFIKNCDNFSSAISLRKKKFWKTSINLQKSLWLGSAIAMLQ